MLAIGQPIIVRDTGRLDVYCATVAQAQADECRPNPLVRIVYIIQYPIQHALMWPDMPNENPPLKAGELARLTFVRRCEAGEEARHSYKDALHMAQASALAGVASEAERAILHRHLAGQYIRRRIELRH